MPQVKLCGYFIKKDKYSQYHIKFCDQIDDKQNTRYKINELKKIGGSSPVISNGFFLKKKEIPAFFDQKNNLIEESKTTGSLVEITAQFKKYSFSNKFGWSLFLISMKLI